MYALTNCTIYTGRDVLRNHAVLINNERIESVIPVDELSASIEQVDLKGANVTAGFIDLQLNGCGGVMLNDAINEIGRASCRERVYAPV